MVTLLATLENVVCSAACPHSRGDASSCFLPIPPRPQVFSSLSNGFLLNLCGDYQVPPMCQALGAPSHETQALSSELRVHTKPLATQGRWQVCRRLARPLYQLRSKKEGTSAPFLCCSRSPDATGIREGHSASSLR